MKLLRDRSGGVTVEFALVVPVFILVFCMSLEVFRIQIASLLLERAVSDIAYQARVARGEGFSRIARRVLQERSYKIFSPSAVKVKARYSDDLSAVVTGGLSGGGKDGSFVHLELEANLSLMSGVLPETWEVKRVIHYYYKNEPGFESGAIDDEL